MSETRTPLTEQVHVETVFRIETAVDDSGGTQKVGNADFADALNRNDFTGYLNSQTFYTGTDKTDENIGNNQNTTGSQASDGSGEYLSTTPETTTAIADAQNTAQQTQSTTAISTGTRAASAGSEATRTVAAAARTTGVSSAVGAVNPAVSLVSTVVTHVVDLKEVIPGTITLGAIWNVFTSRLVIIPLCLIMVITLAFPMMLLPVAASGGDTSKLDKNAAIIAEFLYSKGMQSLQIAAILGNLYQESSWNFDSVEGGGYDLLPGYIPTGIGICQWSNPGGISERRDILEAYAASLGKQWQDPTVQLEFLYSEMSGQGEAMSHAYQRGNYWNWDYFNSLGDLEEAVKHFCTYFLSPHPLYARLEVRTQVAWEVYLKLISGIRGEIPATGVTAEIVRCASSGDLYGCGERQCLRWVAEVYDAAGWKSMPCSCAREAGWKWGTNKSADNIVSGAMIFAGENNAVGVRCGNHDAGHVCIYIGGGMVAENRSGVYRQTPLDEWISIYGFGGWGFYS